jgi:hypothetical protein
LFICFAPAGGGCDSVEEGNKSGGESSSQGVFSAIRHEFNFGVIRPNSSLVHDFSVVNKSKNSWNIDGIKSSCSCTVPDINSKLVEPGGTLKLKVKYKSGNKAGDEARQVVVRLEGEGTPLVFSLRAQVRDPLTVLPASLEIVSAIGSPVTSARLNLYNYSEVDWKSVAVETGCEWLASEFSAPEKSARSAARQVSKVDLTMSVSDFDVGAYSAVVCISCTGVDGEIHSQAVPLSLVVTSHLRPSPRSFFFGRFDSNLSAETSVVIFFPEGLCPAKSTDFIIGHNLGKGLDFKLRRKSGLSWEVTAELPAGSQKGLINGEATVRVNSSGSAVPLKIPIIGMAR